MISSGLAWRKHSLSIRGKSWEKFYWLNWQWMSVTVLTRCRCGVFWQPAMKQTQSRHSFTSGVIALVYWNRFTFLVWVWRSSPLTSRFTLNKPWNGENVHIGRMVIWKPNNESVSSPVDAFFLFNLSRKTYDVRCVLILWSVHPLLIALVAIDRFLALHLYGELVLWTELTAQEVSRTDRL